MFSIFVTICDSAVVMREWNVSTPSQCGQLTAGKVLEKKIKTLTEVFFVQPARPCADVDFTLSKSVFVSLTGCEKVPQTYLVQRKEYFKS